MVGLSLRRFSSRAGSTTPSMSAAPDAIPDCSRKTSVRGASNVCCHFTTGGPESSISTSTGLTSTLLCPRSLCAAAASPSAGSPLPAPARSAPVSSCSSCRASSCPWRSPKAGKGRQLSAHRVGDTVGEIAIVGSAGILERQDGDPPNTGHVARTLPREPERNVPATARQAIQRRRGDALPIRVADNRAKAVGVGSDASDNACTRSR